MPAEDDRPDDAVPLSAWGGPAAGRDAPLDPRVVRTQHHVLDSARLLLEQDGPTGFTFSTLASRARVARATLYRYWAGPEDLVADMIARRTLLPTDRPASSRAVLRGYLVGLRATLADPATAAAYGMLMGAAGHSAPAAEALATVTRTRLDWINERLTGLRPALDEDNFHRLSGPVISSRFFAGQDASDRLIDRTVAGLEPG